MKQRVTANANGKGTVLNLRRGRIAAFMTLILSILTLFACITSVFKESIYKDVLSARTINDFLLVGSTGQDIIFIPLALILALISIIFLVKPGYKLFIAILGLACNFFYGYGLYVMQGMYTSIYLVYLAIFSLSIYSIIFGLLSFPPEFTAKLSLSKTLRISISIFLYFVVIMLGFIWLVRISPDIAMHIPQDTYGVFILDLGIVFPALAIIATKLIQGKPFGNILAGVALMKVITVCLSWGFGEWYGRFRGILQGGYELLYISSVLTLISLIFFILYVRTLKEQS